MTVRTAAVPDAIAIARLEECFPARQRWSETAWREELEASDRVVLVVTDDQQVVAVAAWRAFFETADLHRVIVAPSHRRRGLAADLLARGMAWAIQQGAQWARLEVEQGNEAAVALYDRLGFATVARRSHYYGADRHAIIMEAPLVPEEELS